MAKKRSQKGDGVFLNSSGSRRWKMAHGHQGGPKHDKGGVVGSEYGDGGPPGAGAADEAWAVPAEVAGPCLSARVEQGCELARVGVEAAIFGPLALLQ